MLAIVRGVVAWLLLVTTLVGFSPPPAVAATACTGQIDVWYGNSQTFGGAVGTPQPWVNILGNASGVPNLYYRLNQAGDPNPTATDATETLLTQGTGTGDSEDRRLLLPGDFNVDLGIPGHTAATNDVTVGANTVQIVARDAGGAEICTEPVTVTYQSPTAPGAPFTIDWADAFAGSGCVVGQPCGAINDVAQVIDGKWELTAAGVRTLETGYDRGIAIGDVGWDEYEISAPITIHELASPPEQDRWGGAGFLTGWNGHTDLPNYTYNQGACGGVGVQQPKCGWEPLGAIGWHRPDNPIDPDDPLPRIELFGDGGTIYGSTPMTLVDDPDTAYNFKMRVENIGGENTFRFKVWLVGGAEPDWQITGSEPANHDGAILLLAHHYDVTFGNVTVQPLGLAPVADDDAATVADLGLASVDVLTNDSAGTPPLDPATVAVVSPPSNGSAIPDPATGKIIYTHTATGTTSDSFTYTVADASAQVSNQATVSITITAGETQRKILDLDRPYWKDSYFPENIDPDENPSTLPNDEQFPPIVDQPTTWTGSPNYRQGNWYTRIHVKDKPAPAGEPDKEMWMQLCLWQGPLAAPTGETCTRVEAGQVAFSTEGVHYFDLNSPTMWWNKPGLPFDWAQPASVVRFLLKDAASGLLMNTTRCGDFCYPGTDVNDWMPVDMDVEVIAVGQNATLNPPASWQGECPSEWSPGCSVQTPVVAIDSPLDGSSFMVGDLVEFTATVIDDESGLEPSITWSSTPTGVSGSGPAVSTSSLAAGSYEVTAEVTDSDSLTGSDTITVIVEPPPVNDPILWLALDEGSGALVADASGNGNDGTLMGGPSFVADTNDASSFSVDFDGVDDWVDIGAVDVAGSGLTLVTHFRADSFPGTSRDARMISKATSPARDDHVFMLSTIESGSETRLRGRVRVGGVTTELIADSGDLALDTWYHGALTYEGTTVRLFLDGVEVGATPLTGAVDQDPVLAVAGAAQPGGADKLWDGRLDDIRIFERGLSPGEVAWLAANTVPVAVDGGGVTTVAVPVDVTLSGSDVDDDELIFEIVGSPSDGVLGPISGGDCSGVGVCTAVVSYSPRAGFDGTDSFTFSVSDGASLPAVGTIMVEVIPLPEVSSGDLVVAPGVVSGVVGDELVGAVFDAVADSWVVGVRESGDGSLVSSFGVEDDFVPIDLEVFLEGVSWRVATLGVRDGMTVRVQVNDLATGSHVRNVSFGTGFVGVDAEVVTVDGIDFFAVLSQQIADGKLRVAQKSVDGSVVGPLGFYLTNAFTPTDLEVWVDGVGEPDLVVLGERRDTKKVRIESRDAGTGAVGASVGYGKKYTAVDLEVDPNGDFAVLGERHSDGKVRVRAKTPANTTTVNVLFGATHVPFELGVFTDTGDPDPGFEYGVLGVSPTGQARVWVKDSGTGTEVAKVNFASIAGTPVPQLGVVTDLGGGSTSDEALVMATFETEVEHRLRDAHTTTLIHTWPVT